MGLRLPTRYHPIPCWQENGRFSDLSLISDASVVEIAGNQSMSNRSCAPAETARDAIRASPIAVENEADA